MGQPHEDQNTNSAQHEGGNMQQKRNCETLSLSLSHPSLITQFTQQNVICINETANTQMPVHTLTHKTQ